MTQQAEGSTNRTPGPQGPEAGPGQHGLRSNGENKRSLKIAGIYALCGFLWIVLSDRLLAAIVRDSVLLTRFQTFKGWAFIIVTALLVFFLSRRALRDPERLAAEARASEARFRALFENVNVVALVIDPAGGDLLDANAAAAAFYGWSREQLRSMNISAINTLPGDELRARLREAEDRKRGFFLVKHRRADGSERDVEVYTGPIPFQGGTALYSIIHDVTDRRRAERELADREAMLQQIMDTASVAIFLVNKTGRITHANKRMTEMFRCTMEELIGSEYVEHVHPSERETGRTKMLALLASEIQSVDLERHYWRKDDTEFWGHLAGRRFHDIHGAEIGLIGVITDIDTRKRAEESLRESEEKFRLLVETSYDWIWEVDAKGVYTYASPRIQDLLGYEPREVVGKTPFDLMPPDERERVTDLFREIVRRRDPLVGLENTNLHKDGRRIALETSGLPVFDAGGTFRGYRGVDRDITDRRRAEEALRKSEQMLKTIVDTGPDCIKVTDRESRIIMMNRAGLAMVQADSLDEVRGKIICPLVAPEHRDAFLAMTEKVFQGVPATLEFQMTGMKGRQIWLETYAVPLRNEMNDVTALLGVTRDITGRKRAEEELRESQARLDLALQSAHMGVWRWEVREDRRYFDDLTCQLLGIDKMAFTGSADEFFQVIHPEDRAKVKAALAGVLAQDVLYEPSYRVVWPDGTVRYITARGRLVRDDDGQPERISGILWDITDQHLLEQERLRSQKLESIGTLAGGIAHDFNNLLQGIFGYISMAKLKFDDREISLAMLEQAEMALHQSVSLASQLLTFSKGGKPVKKVLELPPIIEGACKFSLSGSRTDCRIKADDGLWCVEADEGQLGQVVQNIVLNADQAMPEGGTIELAARNVPAGDAALPSGLERGNYVAISIRDSGIGIPAEYVSKIFDPYYTTKEKGSGLGLATSYSIIRNHGGLITVRSAPGTGSTFTVYLPASTERAPKQPARTSPAPGRTGRVLVMDDDDVVRTVAGELLRSLGHEVELAVHGEEAIEKYRQAAAAGRPFDVVILDLTIRGGMGGAETVKKLRELDPGVKAVVSSGYSDDAVTSNYREHGFRSYLSKPYTAAALNDMLNTLMS